MPAPWITLMSTSRIRRCNLPSSLSGLAGTVASRERCSPIKVLTAILWDTVSTVRQPEQQPYTPYVPHHRSFQPCSKKLPSTPPALQVLWVAPASRSTILACQTRQCIAFNFRSVFLMSIFVGTSIDALVFEASQFESLQLAKEERLVLYHLAVKWRGNIC